MHLSPLAHIPTHLLLSVTVWDSYLLSKTMWGSRLLSMIELFPTFLIPKPPYPGCWSSKYSSSPILKLSLYQFTFSLEICSNLLVKKKKTNFLKNLHLPCSDLSLPLTAMFLERTGALFHLILHHSSTHLNLVYRPSSTDRQRPSCCLRQIAIFLPDFPNPLSTAHY